MSQLDSSLGVNISSGLLSVSSARQYDISKVDSFVSVGSQIHYEGIFRNVVHVDIVIASQNKNEFHVFQFVRVSVQIQTYIERTHSGPFFLQNVEPVPEVLLVDYRCILADLL